MSKSTNNAFTGATNSINWRTPPSSSGGVVTAAKTGSPVTLPNSRQVRAYSGAGVPK